MDETKIKPNHKINKFLQMLQMHIIPFFAMCPDTKHHNLIRDQVKYYKVYNSILALRLYFHFISDQKNISRLVMKFP